MTITYREFTSKGTLDESTLKRSYYDRATETQFTLNVAEMKVVRGRSDGNVHIRDLNSMRGVDVAKFYEDNGTVVMFGGSDDGATVEIQTKYTRKYNQFIQALEREVGEDILPMEVLVVSDNYKTKAGGSPVVVIVYYQLS